MPLQLSEKQQRTVAAALTILGACIIVVALGAVFWLFGAFFTRFSNVLLPLAVAAIAALVFKPYFDWMRRRLKFGKGLALVAVFLSVILPLGAFGWFFGAIVVDQVGDLIQKLPGWWENTMEQVRARSPQVVDWLRRHAILDRLNGAIKAGQDALVSGLQAAARGAFTAGKGMASRIAGLLSWAVFPVYFAFFLVADKERMFRIEQFLPFLKEETRKDIAYLVKEFVNIIVAFFRGQLVIAFLQGLLYAVGFWLVGLKYGFIIGLVLGFLNIIPYLGSIIGLGTALPLAFFQSGGGLVKVILVVVVFTVVQLIESYLLTPRIMGDRTGLHPMVIIFAVFFWGSALEGIMGMILAIPLTAFLVVFWRLAKEKYIAELV